MDRYGIAELQATILHLLGLDHKRLTFTRHGREERLTDMYEPNLLEPLLR
jgi:hypothetical protein